MVNKDRLINTFTELVKIDSPSKNERGVADYIKKVMGELGIEVKEDDTGAKINGNTGNLLIKIQGQAQGVPLFLCAHMDTVMSNQGVQVSNDQGTIKTNGEKILGADDKAGVAALLEIVRCIKEQNLKTANVEIIFTVAEEAGLYGSRNLDYNQLEAKEGYILDAGDKVGVIVNKAPGQMDVVIEIHGKAAHSGVNPQDGINAIKIAGLCLAELPLGKIDANGTANIGLINGGTAVNMVPDYVKMVGEVRNFVDESVEKMYQEMKATIEKVVQDNQGKVDIKNNREYYSFEISDKERVIQLANKAAEGQGIEVKLSPRGGGSDTNVFNHRGLSCVNLGMGYSANHTNDEIQPVDELVKATEFVLAIIQKNAEEG